VSKKDTFKSDLNRIDTMTDQEIDYSDIPPLTDEQLAAMRPLAEVLPGAVQGKVNVTLRMDADIARWFQDRVEADGGGDPDSLINAALREHIERQNEPL